MFTQLANREPVARPERRRYQRHALRCQCWLESQALTLYGSTADVGIGGVFLRTAIPVTMGSLVDLMLQVNGEHGCLDARAVIARSVPARPGARHGIGLEFVEIRHGQDALSELLHTYAPLPWL
jgi:hypothetical protein